MENKLIIYSILISFIFAGCNQQKSEISREPNIVLIVADDMGWFDLGCYGNDFIETPNLDNLAQSGIRFTDGYAAAPLCSPSRASIQTGLHPVRVNITEHIHGNPPAGPNQKLMTPPVSQQLDLKYITIAEALKSKGYATAHIGKWHLGGGKFKPEFQGYDVNIAGAWNGLPNSFFYPFFPEGQKPELQEAAKEDDYLTDVLTNLAIDFIEKKKDSAFFLSLNYYSPHVPIEAKKELVEKYQKKRGNDSDSILPNVHYAAMIECIDQNVGRIIKQLKTLNLENETLVVFTSDNGGLSVKEVPAFAKHTPPTDNGILRAGKGYLYEGGIREPFILSWPGVIDEKQVIETPVIAQDLFNTFNEISKIPNNTQDGTSLVPLFRNEDLAPGKLIWHLPHYSPQGGKPVSAMRDGDWKILYFYEEEHYELYNLKTDPGESINLANQYPEKRSEMAKEMHEMLIDMGAKFPEPNPDYTGEKI